VNGLHVEKVGEAAQSIGPLIDDNDFLALLRKPLGDVKPDFTSTDNNDFHLFGPPDGAFASALRIVFAYHTIRARIQAWA